MYSDELKSMILHSARDLPTPKIISRLNRKNAEPLHSSIHTYNDIYMWKVDLSKKVIFFQNNIIFEKKISKQYKIRVTAQSQNISDLFKIADVSPAMFNFFLLNL